MSDKAKALEALFGPVILSLESTGNFRDDTVESPKRMAKAWCHWTSGYETNIAELFKTFDAPKGAIVPVVVSGIRFYSTCEHHGAAIIGSATVGYIPYERIVGLSKIARVVDAFARRLQTQERITAQITETIMEHMTPYAVMTILHARHMCMESRGVAKPGAITTTSCLLGDNPGMSNTLYENMRGHFTCKEAL